VKKFTQIERREKEVIGARTRYERGGGVVGPDVGYGKKKEDYSSERGRGEGMRSNVGLLN